METTQRSTHDQEAIQVMWRLLPQDCRIKQWSQELRKVCGIAFDTPTWALTGHAVLIEAEDADLVRNSVHHIAGESGMQLHLICPVKLGESFAEWLDGLPTDTPCLVYLEPGAWQGPAETASTNCAANTEQSSTPWHAQLGLFLLEQAQTRPIVFVSAAPSFDKLDVSLRSVNHFDRRIKFPEVSPAIYAEWFLSDMADQTLAVTITQNPRKLGELLRHEYPDQRRRSLMQKAMRRLAWREKRPLEFADLVRFATYGTSEVDPHANPQASTYKHAVHEAGHALITHLDSKDQTPPSYCSVLKHTDSHGVVVSPFDSHERTSDDLSYADMCHKVRVWLGGRAAEHLVLGGSEVSAEGASSDLEQATRLACSMMGAWGLPLDLSSDATASANLTVVIGDASASEAKHVENLARQFLQQQFFKSLDVLRAHRAYLDEIIEALVAKKVLIDIDFTTLRNKALGEQATPAEPL